MTLETQRHVLHTFRGKYPAGDQAAIFTGNDWIA